MCIYIYNIYSYVPSNLAQNLRAPMKIDFTSMPPGGLAFAVLSKEPVRILSPSVLKFSETISASGRRDTTSWTTTDKPRNGGAERNGGWSLETL